MDVLSIEKCGKKKRRRNVPSNDAAERRRRWWVWSPEELLCHSLRLPHRSNCDKHRFVIDLFTQQLCLKCPFFHLCFFFFFFVGCLSNLKPCRPSRQRIRVISSTSLLGEQQQQQQDIDSVAWRRVIPRRKSVMLLFEVQRGKLPTALLNSVDHSVIETQLSHR